MQRNVGTTERLLRLSLGLAICIAVLLLGNTNLADSILLVVGSFLILNGLTARCYLWHWLGINSTDNAPACGINNGKDQNIQS